MTGQNLILGLLLMTMIEPAYAGRKRSAQQVLTEEDFAVLSASGHAEETPSYEDGEEKPSYTDEDWEDHQDYFLTEESYDGFDEEYSEDSIEEQDTYAYEEADREYLEKVDGFDEKFSHQRKRMLDSKHRKRDRSLKARTLERQDPNKTRKYKKQEAARVRELRRLARLQNPETQEEIVENSSANSVEASIPPFHRGSPKAHSLLRQFDRSQQENGLFMSRRKGATSFSISKGRGQTPIHIKRQKQNLQSPESLARPVVFFESHSVFR